MNARIICFVVLLSLDLALDAEEPLMQLDIVSPRKRFEWVNPKPSDDPLGQKSVGIRLGKSDYIARGPLIDTFRLAPPRDSGERSLARKILNLPIVNIFVPGPMPKPTRTGKYFAWGEHDTPWPVLTDRPIPGPQSTLVSVSR